MFTDWKIQLAKEVNSEFTYKLFNTILINYSKNFKDISDIV